MAQPVESRRTLEVGAYTCEFLEAYPRMLPGLELKEHDPGYLPYTDATNERIRSLVSGLSDAFAEQFLDDVQKSVRLDDEEVPHWLNRYSHSIGDYRFGFVNSHLLSLAFTVSEYTGGAHPNSRSVVLNLQHTDDGKLVPLELSEIINLKNGIGVLSKVLIEVLKQQEASAVTDGTITAFEQDDLPNFVLTQEGPLFLFDPYAVGAYAEGDFEVLVPWERLEGYGHKYLVERRSN